MPKKQADVEEIQSAERRLKCLELRKAGVSHRAIARQLGITERQVKQDIQHGLAQLVEQQIDNAEQIKAMLLEQINMAREPIVQQVNEGNLKAIDRWITLNEQEIELQGLKPGKATNNKNRPVQVVIEYVMPGKKADERTGTDQDQAGTLPPSG